MGQNLDVLITKALLNIEQDRNTTEELLGELKDYLSGAKDRYAESGTVAAKLVETLQRSNEQLVKLAAIVHKKESTNKLAGGLMAFGWFIYDVNYNGKPTIDWI